MVIHPCAKYRKPMSTPPPKKNTDRTRICTDRQTYKHTNGLTDGRTDNTDRQSDCYIALKIMWVMELTIVCLLPLQKNHT